MTGETTTDAASSPAAAVLYKKIQIPQQLLSPVPGESERFFGGDIRIGDLDGDGEPEFVVFKSFGVPGAWGSAEERFSNRPDKPGPGWHPSEWTWNRSTPVGAKGLFVAAFDLDGNVLWKYGNKDQEWTRSAGIPAKDNPDEVLAKWSKDEQGRYPWQRITATVPYRPGIFNVADFDGDGRDEVFCMMQSPDVDQPVFLSTVGATMMILDGRTGEIKKRRDMESIFPGGLKFKWWPPVPLVANLRGERPCGDIVMRFANEVYALSSDLQILWKGPYEEKWIQPYLPAVGDMDGDGKDEVNVGHAVFDDDGSYLIAPSYEGTNLDSVLVADWDSNTGAGLEAVNSNRAAVRDRDGNWFIRGELCHGQEIRIGNYRPDQPGPQLAQRYNGHYPPIRIVGHDGSILVNFEVDDCPNNTGMQTIHWNGPGGQDLLYSPAAMWDGWGNRAVTFPQLPPMNPGQMTFYHCIPVDVCGDEREEVLLYAPDQDAIYIYTQDAQQAQHPKPYVPSPRQWNVRFLD